MRSGNVDKILTAETGGSTVERSEVQRGSLSSCLYNPIICILAVSLIFVTVGLLIVTAFHQHGQTLTDKMKNELEKINATCSSNQCLKMATGLLTNINSKADPCDDAYSFVCGGYESRKTLQVNKTYRDVAYDLSNEIERRLNELLFYYKDFGMQEKMKQQWKLSAASFYTTCLDGLKDDNNNRANIEREIKRIIVSQTGFIENVNADLADNNFTLVKLLAKFWLNNNPVGFDVEWQKDFTTTKSTPYCLKVASPVHFNTKESEVKDLHRKIFNLLNLKISENTISEMATFHIEMLNKFNGKALVTKPRKEYIQFKSFSETLDNITGQTNLVNHFFKHILKESGQTNAFTAENVCIRQPDKVKEILHLLKRTRLQVIISYGIVNEIMKIYQALPSFIGLNTLISQNVTLNYQEIWSISGEVVHSRCLSVMDHLFRFIMVRIYADAYILPGTKSDLKKMFQNVRESFSSNVKESTFSEDAKRNIIKKIYSIEADISYPDWADEDALMDSIYNNLRFSNNSYIENVFIALQYPNLVIVKKIASGDHSFSFFMESASVFSPTQVNAFYGAYYNRIAFAMGLLRPPLYSPEAPLASRYGFMGLAIGHEIGHAFDPNLHRLNVEDSLKLQEMNLELVTLDMLDHALWGKNSSDEVLYDSKYQCVVDDYGKEKIGSTNSFVNGKGASNNAIPDLAGLRAAFRAYKMLTTAKNEVHRYLIGLTNYTPDQLFFISSTQFFCAKYSNAELEKIFNNQSQYPPPRARVNGMLRNTQEYATAFNCNLGSKMYPKQTCRLW